MKILSVHFHTHDTSVVLVENKKVLYAAANERFSRIKLDRRAPVEAFKKCLSYTNTRPKDLDKVVFVGDPFPKSFLNMFKETIWAVKNTKGKSPFLWKNPLLIAREFLLASGFPSYFYRIVVPSREIKRALKGYKGKIDYVHHHNAHLYSAYYGSGWKTCLVAAIEGSGFDETFSIYHVKNDEWKKILEEKLPNSAGKFYEIVTLLLGFDIWRHPGKITGLSAYGDRDKFYGRIKNILKTDGLSLKLDYNYYLKSWVRYKLKKELPKEWKGIKREDIAAAFQRRLEECIVEIIRKAAERTGENKIALAGGVVANVKLNQKIHEIPEISNIYIQQAMGDDGLALGAALYMADRSGYNIGELQNVYLGPDFKESEILKVLKKNKLKFSKEKHIEKKIAELLSENKVVARFNGRMEFGPRALGNRSILYNTKDSTINDWLNKRLKRTEFMPFAPVTLDKFAEKCYENISGAEYPSRFMTITFNCTEYMKKISPAVVHVDGTARPQIIRKRDNPSYYKILEEYYKLTGIPSLINTSFNMHEEPIVCTPQDAVRSFLSGQLDYLAIGNYLVKHP